MMRAGKKPDRPATCPPAAGRAMAGLALAAGVLLLPATGPAQRTETLPEELEGVGIEEHLGARVPLDATFVDDEDHTVALGQYFGGDKPVILNLGYYSCPMLCGLVSNGLMDAMAKMDWVPGREYEIVTLSIDPTESSTLAGLKKANYIQALGKPEVAGGWHFLVGTQPDIERVTETVGFKYKWVERTGQYAHAAALIVLTPSGEVSRYLYGIEFDPQTLRLSLVEAAEGKVGSSFDRLLLFCFHYDATAGRYAPAARNLMRAGGLVTVLVLSAVLGRFWRRERRRRRETEG